MPLHRSSITVFFQRRLFCFLPVAQHNDENMLIRETGLHAQRDPLNFSEHFFFPLSALPHLYTFPHHPPPHPLK